jgi:small subunit ribosomal protein S1
VGRVRATHKKGDKVKGQIKSITDFGVFIGLDGGIDGLVHLSDLSWDEPGEQAVRNYKKGDESRPWCWPSTSSASASRWASSSSTGDPFTSFTRRAATGWKGISSETGTVGVSVPARVAGARR